MKTFNTTGVCVPSKHYMVDLSERVKQIRKLVDDGRYFAINRARQYGKTTTLAALSQDLEHDYMVISLDFQDISAAVFQTEGTFVQGMSRILCDTRDFFGMQMQEKIYADFQTLNNKQESEVGLDDLISILLRWVRESKKPAVLMIDETDIAVDHQVFLDFLQQLRALYLNRQINSGVRTFQSVILAGVRDIRFLGSKICNDTEPNINNPWSMVADFRIDMSLSEDGIRGMLDEYEKDHNTGMDTALIAKQIRDYTNGYPFLASRICQLMDTEVTQRFESSAKAWTPAGVDEAVKLILSENHSLFQLLMEELEIFPEFRAELRSILMEGSKLTYSVQQPAVAEMAMYGFVRNENGSLKTDNRIFESLLRNRFLSDEELKKTIHSN